MKKNFLIRLLSLTGLIGLLEISGLVLGIDEIGGKVFSTLKTVELPAHFIVQIIVFIATVLALHLFVLLYAYLCTSALHRTLGVQEASAQHFGILTLILTWIAIFLFNNALFNRSLFAYWGTFNLGPFNETNIALLVASIAALPLPIILWWASSTTPTRILISLITCLSALTLILSKEPNKTEASNDKPHIIVIGIDSFRLEYLHAQKLMPNLSQLLEKSAVFTEVYTPIARTFPAWTSMLSGLHPLETGARLNLIDPNQVRRETMLTWPLREAGYDTIFATDERRFNNMDESYGFDTIIGPEAGAADFTLGLVGDLPLVNLISSTWLGGVIFPNLHNNRAITRTYTPQGFVKQLVRELPTNSSKPIFLATHLCLPHWPYKWSEAPTNAQTLNKLHAITAAENTNPEHITHEVMSKQLYESTLPHVDQQIADLLDALRSAGYLENAIVLVLSDHGEAFGAPDETLIDIEDQDMPLASKHRSGHGTSLLSLTQHHTFIAWQRFGNNAFPPGERPQRFYSYDLTPTLLDLLNLESSVTMRGISMLPWMKDKQRSALDRSIFLETGFNLPASNSLSINVADTVSQGINYYRVTNNARLVINPQQLGSLISFKQRGIFRGSQLLAVVPSHPAGGALQFDWILADTSGKSAIKLTPANFMKQCQADCADMLEEFLNFYGQELAPHLPWPDFIDVSRISNDTIHHSLM